MVTFKYGFGAEDAMVTWFSIDCNIIASWSCKWFQGFGCSPMKAVHDLGRLYCNVLYKYRLIRSIMVKARITNTILYFRVSQFLWTTV